MLSTCSLCGSSTRTIILHHGPEHYEIQPFANNFPIWSMIILDSYGMYNTFLHHIGSVFTVSIKNSYPMIVCFTHSFYKQSQKSLIMLKMVSFVFFFDFISYSQIFHKLLQMKVIIKYNYTIYFYGFPIYIGFE